LAATKLKGAALLILVAGLAVAGVAVASVLSPASGPGVVREAELEQPLVLAQARTDLSGDPLPAGALAPLGTERFRLPGWQKIIAFAPDGKTIVSKAETNSLRFWDATNGKLLGEIETDPGALMAVALTPDGKQAVSVGSLGREAPGRAAT